MTQHITDMYCHKFSIKIVFTKIKSFFCKEVNIQTVCTVQFKMDYCCNFPAGCRVQDHEKKLSNMKQKEKEYLGTYEGKYFEQK